MNFYSEDIIGDIMKTKPVKKVGQKIGDFYETVFTITSKFSDKIVSCSYILSLLTNRKNSVAFRCIDTTFNIHNCPSILIYNKFYDVAKNEHIYSILMICTKRSFKNMGYASKLLDDFIDHIRNNRTDDSSCKIVLSSIESAVTFYEQYGFKWMRTSLNDYPKLMEFERYDESKEYFILELQIKP